MSIVNDTLESDSVVSLTLWSFFNDTVFVMTSGSLRDKTKEMEEHAYT